MMDVETTESKSDFARRCGVDPSRVTRWIEQGIIGTDAIVGAGRGARILVALALQHVAERRDQGQVLGNGAKTRTSGARSIATAPETGKSEALISDALEPEPAGADDLDPGSPEYQRERARLVRAQAEAQEMKNALARREVATIAAIEHKTGVRNLEIRSRLLALPGRLRTDIARLTEAEIKIIDTAVRAILKDLVHD